MIYLLLCQNVSNKESAAASEELASQATLLDDMVSSFKLKDIKDGKDSAKNVSLDKHNKGETQIDRDNDINKVSNNISEDRPSIVLSDSEFGKY